MADWVRQRLSQYDLIHLLGRGDFSAVYLGRQPHLDMPVAIKVFEARLTGEEAEYFRAAVSAIARLKHPLSCACWMAAWSRRHLFW